MSNIIDEQLYTSTETGIPEQYLRAYFGPQADYYISKYNLYRQGNKYTFNISCFFAGMFWLLYRKMFVHFIVVLAILFASGLIEEVLFLLDVDYNAVQGLGFVFNISFAVAFGLLGNFFYLKKSEERMLEIINSTNDEEQKLEVLARKGGISYSPYYVLGGIVLLLFIIGMFA